MDKYRQILFQYVTTAIGGLAIIINLSEIMSLVHRKKNRYDFALTYIFSLSVSDFLVGTWLITLKSMHPFMETTLKGNIDAQNAYNVIRFGCIRFALFMSIFNLAALSIDRVTAVVTPIKYRTRSKKKLTFVIAGLWISAFCCISLYYWMSQELLQNAEKYIDLVFPVAIYSAAVIFILCYGIIFHSLVKHRRIIQIETKEIQLARSRRSKTEVKVVKIAVMNITIFIICWVPLATVAFIRAVDETAVSASLFSTFFTLASFSTVINPCIYWIRTRKIFSAYTNTSNTATPHVVKQLKRLEK